MNKNRNLAIKLGIPWHEPDPLKSVHCHIGCCCGEVYSGYNDDEELTNHCKENNPDFTIPDGIVLLLREMMKRKDWPDFANTIGKANLGHYYSYVEVDYILEPGKLRNATLEWMEREKK